MVEASGSSRQGLEGSVPFSEARVWGLGFGDLGFRVWGLGFAA